jgi:NDP-sugar pyrophosphorylase family protein
LRKVTAVILCGGLGRRLQPLTFSVPKPLLPVGERPILEMVVRRLKTFGLRDFVFCVGYRAELIKTYFGNGSKHGVRISYCEESKPLGTAGPLSLVWKRLKLRRDESVLLMNGDILTKLNFRKFIAYHEKHGFSVTVGVKQHDEQLPYGVLQISDHQVRGIVEKPVQTYSISAGIYLIQAPVLREVPPNRFFTVPELITRMLTLGKPVGAYAITEYWIAIEQLHHVEKAQSEVGKWLASL